MRWKYAALLALVLGLVACSPGRPGEGEICDLVAEAVGAAGDDAYTEIREFRRVDGRDACEGRYVTEVEYDLVYLVSNDQLIEQLGRQRTADIETTDDPPSGMAAHVMVMGNAVGLLSLKLDPIEKGETRHKTQTVTLERWETGWRLEAPQTR